jgi:lysophospholipase L1-like esterase
LTLPRRAVYQKLALSFGSVLVFFGVAEGLARLKYSPGQVPSAGIFQYDPDKLYALKPSHVGAFAGREVKTNSLGYRDSEVAVPKPEGTFRALVIGDSIAFGHGVDAEHTFSEVLERRLNQESVTPGRTFEVVNTAVPGNSPFQEYYDLVRAERLQPDVVVFQFTPNDVVEPYQVLLRLGGAGKDYHGIQDLPRIHYFLSERSAFYLLLRAVLARVSLWQASGEQLKSQAWAREEYQVKRLVENPDDPLIRDAWAECLREMEKMVAFCRERGWPMVMLYVPAEFQLSLAPELARPQQVVARFAAERDIPFIDLLALLHAQRQEQRPFTEVTDKEELWSTYFLDPNHLNEHGHLWATNQLSVSVAPASGTPAGRSR